MKLPFGHIQTIHIIGIGGIGMSSIAEFLLSEGLKISGSDARSSEITRRLEKKGIRFCEGHRAENIEQVDLVVHSSAVPRDNPEILEAHKQNIPVIKRPALLREIVKMKRFSMGVAGTHGKTSTSSMLLTVLMEAGLDPTAIIGGIDKSLHSNARTGKGPYMVIEADEYDRTFLALEPSMGIVTSIETDHLDIYRDLEDIRTSFLQYCNAIPFWGRLFVCVDDPQVRLLYPDITAPCKSYGFHSEADLRICEYTFKHDRSHFRLEGGANRYGPFTLRIPGRHAVQNATAVIGLAFFLGIPEKTVISGLQNYKGVERRFDLKGFVGKVPFIDDYAHHPSEIRQTLLAVRDQWPGREIVCIFQPHLYSRTRDFAKDFATALSEADRTVVTDIYPAREKPIPDITSRLITDYMTKPVRYLPDIKDLSSIVPVLINENSVVIAMGAGDITHYFDEFFKTMNKNSES